MSAPILLMSPAGQLSIPSGPRQQIWPAYARPLYLNSRQEDRGASRTPQKRYQYIKKGSNLLSEDKQRLSPRRESRPGCLTRGRQFLVDWTAWYWGPSKPIMKILWATWLISNFVLCIKYPGCIAFLGVSKNNLGFLHVPVTVRKNKESLIILIKLRVMTFGRSSCVKKTIEKLPTKTLLED